MTAFLLADIEVTDPQTYEGYKKGVSASIAAFGGRYIARGGRTEVLEGAWTPKRLVIVEFPSMEKLRQWYESPEYRPFRDLRQKASLSNLVVTDGI